MPSILLSAENHQKARKARSCEEFKQLCEATQFALKEKEVTLEQVVEALKEDASIIKNLDFSEEAEALRYNKLSFLLDGAVIFAKEQWQSIIEGTLSEKVNSWGDTSLMNYAQTALLEILSIIRENCKISEIPELKREGIYQDKQGSNIQSIGSPQLITQSRWVIDDPQLPGQLRLVIPHLGYWYDGSRFLPEYATKEFAAQDCSSWVAKLTGASEPFSTINILNVSNPEAKSADDIAAKEVLLPIAQPVSGAIFCVRGHCGIVKEYETSEECSVLRVLSYARMMPGLEGCVEQIYDCRSVEGSDEGQAKWQIRLRHDDLPKKLIQAYYGLDNGEGAFDSVFRDAYFFVPVDKASIIPVIN